MTFPQAQPFPKHRYEVRLSLTGGKTWGIPIGSKSDDRAVAQRYYDKYVGRPASDFTTKDPSDPAFPQTPIVKLVDWKYDRFKVGTAQEFADRAFYDLLSQLNEDGARDRHILLEDMRENRPEEYSEYSRMISFNYLYGRKSLIQFITEKSEARAVGV
jgi:hypothetical protein